MFVDLDFANDLRSATTFPKRFLGSFLFCTDQIDWELKSGARRSRNALGRIASLHRFASAPLSFLYCLVSGKHEFGLDSFFCSGGMLLLSPTSTRPPVLVLGRFVFRRVKFCSVHRSIPSQVLMPVIRARAVVACLCVLSLLSRLSSFSCCRLFLLL